MSKLNDWLDSDFFCYSPLQPNANLCWSYMFTWNATQTMLLLNIKLRQFHFTSLLFPKWCRLLFHGNVEINAACPMLLVVARLWGKRRVSQSYFLFLYCYGPSCKFELNWNVFATTAPTIIPLGNARGGFGRFVKYWDSCLAKKLGQVKLQQSL